MLTAVSLPWDADVVNVYAPKRVHEHYFTDRVLLRPKLNPTRQVCDRPLHSIQSSEDSQSKNESLGYPLAKTPGESQLLTELEALTDARCSALHTFDAMSRNGRGDSSSRRVGLLHPKRQEPQDIQASLLQRAFPPCLSSPIFAYRP